LIVSDSGATLDTNGGFYMDASPARPSAVRPDNGEGSGAPALVSVDEVRTQLERVLESRGFRGSARLQRFLRLAVERTLAGETDLLKEYSVGRDAFDRGADYDPRSDSIVRVEAQRLRRKLREYYRGSGAEDPIVIHLVPGSYVPEFKRVPSPLADILGETSVSTASAQLDPRTVAVLPFSNLSLEPAQQYFCDGITEDIINALTPIGDLQVIGRTSMFALKRGIHDPREIGARLGAGTIVEGSVRKAGKMLRVSAKIIDSETRQTTWSQVFDRKTQDLFAIEDEIAHSIAGTLRVTLRPSPPLEASHKAPSVQAHVLYLKGRQAWNRVTRAGFKSAIDLFSRAISLYPDYAPPYAGLADAFFWFSWWEMMPPKEALAKGKSAALEALRLDSGLAAAHTSLGAATFFFEKHHAEGLAQLQKAIELQPSYATAHQLYGICLVALGRFEEGLTHLQRAVQLDPLSIRTNRSLGIGYYFLGRGKEAEQYFEAAIALDPEALDSHHLLARLYLQEGQIEKALREAREIDQGRPGAIPLSILGVCLARSGDVAGAGRILKRLEKMSAAGYVDPLASAFVEAALGNFSAAIGWVRKSLDGGSPLAALVNVDPLFEGLRSAPGFDQFVGLPSNPHR
jgi:adenylate cyclase